MGDRCLSETGLVGTLLSMRKGIAVSPGVAVGTAYCIHEIFVNPETHRLEASSVTAELGRWEDALEKTADDLRALETKVAAQIGRNEADIFAVHQSILRDASFTNKVRDAIVNRHLNAPAALHELVQYYSEIFSKTADEYLRERFNDIRDVAVRLSSHLSDVVQPDQKALRGPLIVVTDELLPSHVVALGDVDVCGIVTQKGSQTSHAAIIARSRGIPAVSGVGGILKQVRTGATIVVDGCEGCVHVDPHSESLSAFRKLQREFFHLRDQLAENRDLPAVTADGTEISLLANINGLPDAKAAQAMGASGVGLYRTEYLYLTHQNVPDEKEQLELYRDIILASPNQSITLRTLDIGGDKTVAYLGNDHHEANPFMGWRSIRLSFEHPEFFLTQIRAVLRAAALVPDADVRLLFPMITTVEEVRRLRTIVRKAQKQLVQEGKRFREVSIGMMLEVPAAAISIDTMLHLVDFVSIGSNDLVQYLMAADRDNPKVSHLCQPLSLPVLRILGSVIAACNQAQKPVTVCGEMAGQPRAFVLLLGMGLRSFSMSSAFIPTVKQLASQITVAQAEEIYQESIKLKTTVQIKRFMADQLQRLAPNLTMLETA